MLFDDAKVDIIQAYLNEDINDFGFDRFTSELLFILSACGLSNVPLPLLNICQSRAKGKASDGNQYALLIYHVRLSQRCLCWQYIFIELPSRFRFLLRTEISRYRGRK